MPLEGKREKHESYGMIGFSRRTGRYSNLFGSSIKNHDTTICLEVTEGEVTHDLSHDWYYGSKPILRLVMSQAQFAELITGLNTGPGVPCTLEAIRDGKLKRVEPPPDHLVEVEKIKHGFGEKIAGLVQTIQNAIKEAEEIRAGAKSPRKGDVDKLISVLNNVLMEVRSNAPFVVDSFAEATDKIISTAKTEIDSFIATVAHQTGLKTMREMQIAKFGTPDAKELPGSREAVLDSTVPLDKPCK